MRRSLSAPPSISSQVNFLPRRCSAFKMTLTASEAVKCVYLNPCRQGIALVKVVVSSDLEIVKNHESGSVGDTRGSSRKLSKTTHNSSQLVMKMLLTELSQPGYPPGMFYHIERHPKARK